MNKPNTKCRVCGKEYFCCADSKKINSWRAMACSIECYQEYMNRIEKSRNPIISEIKETGNQENIEIPNIKNRKRKSIEPKITSKDIIIEN